MPEFSTPALHAIEHVVEQPTLSTAPIAHLSLSQKYEVPSTLHAILSGGYKTIALQFPDEMLADSVLVYRALMAGLKDAEERNEGGTGVQCFVLGDSTYGSCCPDVLSAMHLPADFLVHYGHACLTPTTALPVMYVFPKLLFPELQISSAADELYVAASSSLDSGQMDGGRSVGKKAVVVVWEVGYEWMRDQIHQTFQSSSSRPLPHIPLIFAHIKKHHDEKLVRPTSTTPLVVRRECEVDGSRGCGQGGCCTESSVTSDVRDGSRTAGCACRTADENADGTLSTGIEHVTISPRSNGSNDPSGDGQDRPSEAEGAGPQREEIVDLGGIQIQIPLSAEGEAVVQAPVVPKERAGDAGKRIMKEEEDTGSLRQMDLPEGLEMKDCVIFYIGEESRGMINLMMENARSEIWQYSPSTSTTTSLHRRTPMLLRPRLFALSRFLSIHTIGILVHNVGLHSSRPLIKKIKEELKRKGKKSYTVSVGRLNPAKVGNLEVVEGWVLVGCREGGMVDPKEYSKPIITPHELFLSLQGESGIARWADADRFGWTLDMGRVMREADTLRKEEESGSDADGADGSDADDKDADRPVFSLVSGQYHSTTRSRSRASSHSSASSTDEARDPPSALTLRPASSALTTVRTLISPASDHLAERTYKGLDPLEGYDEQGVLEPSVLEAGRRGVARGYGMVGDRANGS